MIAQLKYILATLAVGSIITANAEKSADYKPEPYTWTTQSHNSSESMPCGGHDIGLNVWVENGDVLIYMAQSGWFDENNTLLKAGRLRLHVDGNQLDDADFKQTLNLDGGNIEITGGGLAINIWVDTENPTIFCDVKNKQKARTVLSFESWRYKDRIVSKDECQQTSYKWFIKEDCTTFADNIVAERNKLTFTHKNRETTIFDFTVEHEKLSDIKDQLYNPLAGRLMQGIINTPGLNFEGTSDGTYTNTDYKAWNFAGTVKNTTISVALGTSTPDGIEKLKLDEKLKPATSRKRSSAWWHSFWQRSYIYLDPKNGVQNDTAATMIRNYEFFRYMLGCNAKASWPMKFNGGLFTFDPVYSNPKYPYTPDFRNWGGGVMTAQNQRLVYWPMLKSGDLDILRVQLNTYKRMLGNAVKRSQYYWGHDGASFTEQMENFGLPNPAEYGKPKAGNDIGVERNAWLEYLWDTSLEFCQMALEANARYNMNITEYEELIWQCLHFFDEHYRYVARKNGSKELTEDKKLMLYPGSGAETYKMAYNASSTIAALKTVGNAWLSYAQKAGKDSTTIANAQTLIARIPELPMQTIDGYTCIAPAVAWARIQNEETPQMYPVFPWRMYGVGRPNIEVAINTWTKDPQAIKMKSIKGWKQDNIWAACLGLADEAAALNGKKLANGPFRFPAFWDRGFDWAPDINRGGAAMIGLQEMLLQYAPDGSKILLPAWPKRWGNVIFKLN